MILGPYHLISTGVLLILSYLVSLTFLRLEIIPQKKHRKFWNTLLLIFFASTAALGLLLVVQVNYKLTMAWVESVMQWHVDLGIGFAFVAVFHLSWHLRYYTRPVQLSPAPSELPWIPHFTFTAMQEKLFFLLLGYVSIMAQLVLLREFVKTLHGNELFIGIFLALWMILSATGARTGTKTQVKISKSKVLGIVLFMGTAPLLIYMALIMITRFLFLPGYEPGMLPSITVMILLAGPLALSSGFLFAYVSKSLVDGRRDSSYYSFDSLGSLLAGFLFGLVLVFFLDNVQSLSFLFLMTGLSVVVVFRHPAQGLSKSFLLLAATSCYILLLFPELRTGLEGWRFQGEKLLETRDTPYGNLAFTEKGGQVTAYLDRNPVLSSGDLAANEERIHYAALQHPDPSTFLLLGNGLSGSASEISKYAPERIDYCEADPWIFRLGSSYLSDSLPGSLRFIPMDGRKWLMHNDTISYDVLISVSGDPLSIGWNRFYTIEFFSLVHEHLTPGGVFSMQLSSAGSYIDNQGSELLSINYHTLSEIFKHVLVVPGNVTWFLASDSPLSLDFPALLEHHPVETSYVHPDYMELKRLTFDSDQVMDRILLEEPRINSDLRPRLFFSRLKGIESIDGSHTMVVSGILGVLIFLVLFFAYPPIKKSMYVSGFTGAGFQILLIMVMQSLFGFAYLVTPLMITLFMAGIVLGTKLWKPVWGTPGYVKLSGLLGIMALMTLLTVLLLNGKQISTNRIPGMLILGSLNVIPGLIVGSVYGMSLALSGKEKGVSMGQLFNADLAGAALGTFVPVIFLLPLIGVTFSFILFCGINLATGLYVLISSVKSKHDG
jgi:spermidine synthase